MNKNIRNTLLCLLPPRAPDGGSANAGRAPATPRSVCAFGVVTICLLLIVAATTLVTIGGHPGGKVVFGADYQPF